MTDANSSTGEHADEMGSGTDGGCATTSRRAGGLTAAFRPKPRRARDAFFVGLR